MKLRSLPFLYVLLSCLIPMVGAAMDLPTFHAPVILIILFLLMAMSAENNSSMKAHKSHLWMVSALMTILAVQVITGRGFVILAAGGYVIILTFFFYSIFTSSSSVTSLSLIRGISTIYKFLLICMLIETVVVILGGQPLLVQLFQSSNSPGYKSYNQADIPRMLGLFQDYGGINSILMGSQIAGMLSLFATIWFISINKLPTTSGKSYTSTRWIFLSFLLLFITLNGTIVLLILIAVMLYLFKINQKHKLFYMVLFGLIAVAVFLLIQNGMLFDRIFSSSAMVDLQDEDVQLNEIMGGQGNSMIAAQYYIAVFYLPIYYLFMLDLINLLIGIGGPTFLSEYSNVTGDFGFGTDVLLKSGLVWSIIFVLYLCFNCLPRIKPVARFDSRKTLSVIGSTNALISLLWLVSTVHYNQALSNVGGIALFAMHLSVVFYCRAQEKYQVQFSNNQLPSSA